MKLEGRGGSSSGIKSDGRKVWVAIEGESNGIRWHHAGGGMSTERPHT